MLASESTLLLFATHLGNSNISYATIKIYLSAVRHMHVTTGMHNFFTQQLTPWLQQVLKGIQKSQTLVHPPRERLPITMQIMEDTMQLLSQRPKSYMNVMTWAACCLAFFKFLRVSEFTIPFDDLFNQGCHLCLSDIAIDNRDNPKNATSKDKAIKNRPLSQGSQHLSGCDWERPMSHKRHSSIFSVERQSFWPFAYALRWQRPYSETLQGGIG